MANRYYQPVRSEELNYYAPLPFSELYQVGSAMASRADKAKNDLAEYVEKYSKFKSPSQTDTSKYYDLSMGRIRPVVDDLVSNPDKIKTMEGRAAIANAINSADYAALSQLEQSRDNMLKRQAMEQELSMKGQYNPYWHGVDYAKYDTSSNGVFNNLNLTPWESIKAGTNQYFDSLKDSYLSKSNNVWTWTGVDEKMLQDTAAKNVNAYAQTQAGQMHMKEAIAKGLTTPDKAQDWLKDQMVQSNREYLRENQTLNPLFHLNMTIAAQNARSKKGSGAEGEGGFSKSQQIVTALNQRVKDVSIVPNKGFHNYLDTLNRANSEKFPKDLMDAIKTQTTDSGMRNLLANALQLKQPNGKPYIDEASANKIYSDFTKDRQSQINNHMFAEQGYADRFKLEENTDAVRKYYGIDLDSNNGKRKNFEITDKSGKYIGTFGRVSSSTLSGAVPMTSNDKIMSEISIEGLKADKKFQPGMDTPLPVGAYGSLVAHARGSATETSNNSMKALKTMSDVNTGLIKYLTSRASRFGNNIYMEPTNEVSMMQTGNNGEWNSVSYNNVALPKNAFVDMLNDYAKDNKLDMSGNDLLKILEGKSIREFKVVDVVNRAKGHQVTDSQKASPAFDEDMVTMRMIVPFLQDPNRRVNLDNTYNQENFGKSSAGKFLDYQLDYNFSPEAVQNSEGITPLNYK